jgi:hypothetical protein
MKTPHEKAINDLLMTLVCVLPLEVYSEIEPKFQTILKDEFNKGVHEALIAASENALLHYDETIEGYVLDKESVLSVEPKLIKK